MKGDTPFMKFVEGLLGGKIQQVFRFAQHHI